MHGRVDGQRAVGNGDKSIEMQKEPFSEEASPEVEDLARSMLSHLVGNAVKRLIHLFLGPHSDQNGEPVLSAQARRDGKFADTACRMHRLWDGFSPDRSVLDPTRLHRVAGSVNEKSGKLVRLLWPDTWSKVARWSFDDIRDCIHPYTKRDVDKYRQEKRDFRLPWRIKANIATSSKARARWGVVAEDLAAWIEFLGPEGLEHRHRRELAAFHLACAWANAGRTGSIRDWVPELAQMTGLEQEELEGTLQSLKRRVEEQHALAKQHAKENRLFSPPERSRVYGYRLGSITRDLGITEADVAGAHLRRLIPGGGWTPLPSQERSSVCRRRRGARSRDQMKAARLSDAAIIEALAEEGLSFRAIAPQIGKSATYVRKAMKDAGAIRRSALVAGTARDSTRILLIAERPLDSVEARASASDPSGEIGGRTPSPSAGDCGRHAVDALLPPGLVPASSLATADVGDKEQQPRFQPVGPPGSDGQRFLAFVAYAYRYTSQQRKVFSPSDCEEIAYNAVKMAEEHIEYERSTGKLVFPRSFNIFNAEDYEVVFRIKKGHHQMFLRDGFSEYLFIAGAGITKLIRMNVLVYDGKSFELNGKYC